MSDYKEYSFTIKESDLLRTLKEANDLGYPPMVVINGEYYDIKFDNTSASDKNNDKAIPF